MPSRSSAPDMRAHCWPGSKMQGIFNARHSSAYWIMAAGSFGDTMTSPGPSMVRNESSAACDIAPV
jgi:hypothetical protein